MQALTPMRRGFVSCLEPSVTTGSFFLSFFLPSSLLSYSLCFFHSLFISFSFTAISTDADDSQIREVGSDMLLRNFLFQCSQHPRDRWIMHVNRCRSNFTSALWLHVAKNASSNHERVSVSLSHTCFKCVKQKYTCWPAATDMLLTSDSILYT